MFSDPPLSAFDALYVALNMLDRNVSDSTDKLIFLNKNAPNAKVAFLVLWLLSLRQTLPLLYEAQICPLKIFRQTIHDLIKQKHPVLDRKALYRISMATQHLTLENIKKPYSHFLRLLWPLMAIPDSPIHLSAIIFEFERQLVDRLCQDNDYHMYWRRFCLLHDVTWKQARAHTKWPASLLSPTSKYSGPKRYMKAPVEENQESTNLIWPFDVAQFVQMYDTFDWVDHARPDRDYSHFGICIGVLLTLFAVRVASRCFRSRSRVDNSRIEDDILEY